MEKTTSNRIRTKTEEQKAQAEAAQVEAFLANPIQDGCLICGQPVAMDGTAVFSRRHRAFAHDLCHANAILAAQKAAKAAAAAAAKV